MKKFIGVFITAIMTFSCMSPVFANDESVLLENGVTVTMSSAGMEAGANSTDNGTADPTIKRDLAWYKSDLVEIENKNSTKDSLDLVEINSTDATIKINDEITYQSYLGNGTSLDDSTIYNLSKMSDEKQEEVIRLLIDPNEGAGMTLFRLCIGSSDYTREGQSFYSYYDIKGTTLEECTTRPEYVDWYNTTGSGFSIQTDRDLGIIDTIKKIQRIAKEYGVEDEISFFASPWSIPGWMKEHGNITNGMQSAFTNKMNTSYTQVQKDTLCYGLLSGQLRNDAIDDAAMYFVRYLEEYAKEGINIEAITIANEPGQDSPYPNTAMTAEQSAKVSSKIKELLNNSDIDSIKDTKIWAGDYNAAAGSHSDIYPGAVEYFQGMLNVDPNSFDGYAMHDYSAGQLTMEALNEMHNIDSTKELIISERSLWGTYGMNRIVQYLRNNAIGYCSWVTMLDSNVKSHQMMPSWIQAFYTGTDPTLLVQDASNTEEYRALPEVYLLGQFSKYIRPGYVRVESTDSIGDADYGISNVVFKNPDTGKLVMVVVNNSNEEQTFTAAGDNYQFTATIPATNVATYQWNPNDIDVTAPVISGQDATIYVGDNTDVKTLLNLSVVDDKDGEISDYKINLNGYDYQKAGEYTIEIIAQDKTGNSSNASYKITVLNKTEGTVENTDDGNEPDNTDKVAVSNQGNTLSNKKSVKTGDSANLVGMFAILSVALLGIIICLKKKYNH